MPFGVMPPPDVVDYLVSQHAQARDLMATVLRSAGEERRHAFRRLVRLLSVHETAEEEVVHPLARAASDSRQVADRLAEEHDAKELLARLDGMDVDDPAFPPLFARLREAVLTHAISEQRYEFNRIRQRVPAAQRAAMRALVRAAEATAPTHPHPGVESATVNLLLGPPVAIMDRARDAIRRAREGTAEPS
jgi:hemerythrin superfamily protein